jgi:hypothetical protein
VRFFNNLILYTNKKYMSRIGKMPVVLADKVEARIFENMIEVK